MREGQSRCASANPAFTWNGPGFVSCTDPHRLPCFLSFWTFLQSGAGAAAHSPDSSGRGFRHPGNQPTAAPKTYNPLSRHILTQKAAGKRPAAACLLQVAVQSKETRLPRVEARMPSLCGSRSGSMCSPQGWCVWSTDNRAYCTEYLPYILKQPRSHPCQHALGVPAPCGSRPGPYLSSCTSNNPRDQLGSVASFPGLNTAHLSLIFLALQPYILLPTCVCFRSARQAADKHRTSRPQATGRSTGGSLPTV